MNYWASRFPPQDPNAVYLAKDGAREVEFVAVPGETHERTARRLLGGRLTELRRIR